MEWPPTSDGAEKGFNSKRKWKMNLSLSPAVDFSNNILQPPTANTAPQVLFVANDNFRSRPHDYTARKMCVIYSLVSALRFD